MFLCKGGHAYEGYPWASVQCQGVGDEAAHGVETLIVMKRSGGRIRTSSRRHLWSTLGHLQHAWLQDAST